MENHRPQLVGKSGWMDGLREMQNVITIMLFIYCGSPTLFHPSSTPPHPLSLELEITTEKINTHACTKNTKKKKEQREKKITTTYIHSKSTCCCFHFVLFFFSLVQRFVILSLFVLFCRRTASAHTRGVREWG